MKNRLKNLGLAGLTGLALGGGIKEGIAQTTQGTNKDIQGVFAEKKDWKGHKPETYTATADGLKEQNEKKADTLDATQAVAIFNDTINALIKSYGKEGLNKKIREINEKHHDFLKLPEAKQKEIIMEKFADQKDSIFSIIGKIVAIIFLINLARLGARLTGGK